MQDIIKAELHVIVKKQKISQNKKIQMVGKKLNAMKVVSIDKETKTENMLVTVEVKNNKVVQSRIKCNKSPNEKQLEF